MQSSPSRSQQQELDHLRSINASYASKIARLEFRLSMAEGELARAEAELKAQRRLRTQVKELYHSVDAYILGSIDRRGYKRKTKSVKFSDINLSADVVADASRLQQELAQYDSRSFFRLHSPKTAMKLRYRLASKAYRVGRDTTLKTALKTYRLSKKVRRG